LIVELYIDDLITFAAVLYPIIADDLIDSMGISFTEQGKDFTGVYEVVLELPTPTPATTRQ